MPWLASPAIASPAATLTVSGRNSGIATVTAASPTNSPLFVIWSRNAGPRPGEEPPTSFSATPMRTGMSASAASMAHVRHRRNCVDSSLPSSRSVPQPPEPAATGPSQATTSKPSPVSCTNRCSRLCPQQLEAAHAHTALDERGDEVLGDRVGRQYAGDDVEIGCRVPGVGRHAPLREHGPRGVDVGGAHAHARQCAGAAEVVQRALRDEPSAAHHTDVAAQLLDLGEQVARDEHRACRRRRRSG